MKNLFIGGLMLILACTIWSCTNKNSSTVYVSKYSQKLKSDSSSKTVLVYSHQFSKGYNTLYPASHELYYHKIGIIVDPYGNNFTFQFDFINTYQNFDFYEFQQDHGNKIISKKGNFLVHFNKQISEDTYSSIKINVVTRSKEMSSYEIQLSFDPKIVQERNGRHGAKDGLYIRNTDVPFLEILSEDFIKNNLTGEEKKFLHEEFGKNLNQKNTESEKISVLATEVINLLEKYRGIPSNTMDTLSAIEQLMILQSGNEKIWCGNIAKIFSSVCLAFDIPARCVGLGNTYDNTTDPAIYHSDFHTTTEVYNKEYMTWCLIDLSFYIVDIKTKNGRHLNFIDFLFLLNSSDERNNIVVSEYDPESKRIKFINVSQSKNFLKIMDYYKQNQKFYFPHKGGYYTF